jgi:predicted ArsR family transcriptional regulator
MALLFNDCWSYAGCMAGYEDRGAVAAVAALDDDLRAALHAFVREAHRPVTREEAAEAVGISRKLAAFHLDKLVAAGLLDVSTAEAGQRRVGRAPRVYAPSRREVAVSVPARDHGMLAEILVGAVVEERDGERAGDAALRVARERGRAMGEKERERLRPGRLGPERALTIAGGLLERHGFEPVRDGDEVRLRNCPFHPLSNTAPQLVCSLNHALLCGLLEGLQVGSAIDAVLEPPAATDLDCCVQLRARR